MNRKPKQESKNVFERDIQGLGSMGFLDLWLWLMVKQEELRMMIPSFSEEWNALFKVRGAVERKIIEFSLDIVECRN